MIFNIILIGSGIIVFLVIIVGIVICIRATNGSIVEGENRVVKGKISELLGVSDVSRQPEKQKSDSAELVNLHDVKEFLPVQGINGFVADLGDYQYRAVIECSSLNRSLKTTEENQSIDALFQRCLNSIKFPFRFYIQTREIDNYKVVESLEKDIQTNIGNLPALEEYANLYLEGMKNLSTYVGNTKQKKKYIIVSYDDAWKMDSLSDAEKEEFAVSELRTRVYTIKEGIESVGVTPRVLYSSELYEVLYACYHRDSYSVADGIADGDYTSLVVPGRTVLSDMTDAQLTDVYLQGLINQLQAIVKTNKKISSEDLDRYHHIIKVITVLQSRIKNPSVDFDEILLMASGEDAEILGSMFGESEEEDQKKEGDGTDE